MAAFHNWLVTRLKRNINNRSSKLTFLCCFFFFFKCGIACDITTNFEFNTASEHFWQGFCIRCFSSSHNKYPVMWRVILCANVLVCVLVFHDAWQYYGSPSTCTTIAVNLFLPGIFWAELFVICIRKLAHVLSSMTSSSMNDGQSML